MICTEGIFIPQTAAAYYYQRLHWEFVYICNNTYFRPNGRFKPLLLTQENLARLLRNMGKKGRSLRRQRFGEDI